MFVSTINKHFEYNQFFSYFSSTLLTDQLLSEILKDYQFNIFKN